MADLIDRQQLIERLRPFGREIPHEMVVNAVMRMPNATKTGRWVNDEHDMPRCSECGYIPEFNRHIDDYYYSDYCPNCGAYMSGEDGERE